MVDFKLSNCSLASCKIFSSSTSLLCQSADALARQEGARRSLEIGAHRVLGEGALVDGEPAALVGQDGASGTALVADKLRVGEAGHRARAHDDSAGVRLQQQAIEWRQWSSLPWFECSTRMQSGESGVSGVSDVQGELTT